MKTKTVLAGGLLAALIAAPQMVSAAIIVDPVGATASHQQSPQSIAAFAIDGKGLSDATVVETGDPVPGTYPTHSTSSGDMWRTLSTHPIAGVTIAFDLGGTYDLTGMHVWNYNEFWTGGESSRGINEVTVEYSTDGGTAFTPLAGGNLLLAQAPSLVTYTGEDYSFGSTLTGVTDVRFTVVSNHGGDRVGLSEVRFVAIPEPATLGLIGVFGVGTLFIRRRLMM